MEPWLQTLLTTVCSVAASSGFWAWMMKKSDKKDNRTKLLLGICHDRILSLGMEYLERDPGYLTKDEYVNLIDYLAKPYFALGGNGSAHKIIEDCKKLPIRNGLPQVRMLSSNEEDCKS